jgi:hypothetical protein
MFGKRAEQEQLAALRAEVQGLQARLSADVSTLDPGDDPMSRQALVDAGERQTAAGSLLSTASTVGELRVAHRIVVEGLTATRLVRERRGLPLGPDLPDLTGPTVNQPTTVNVNGQPQVAHPGYHPDQPHFFGGNNMAPAGYYRTPFWKKALGIGGAVLGAEIVGSALGDMFGGERGDWGDRGDWGGDRGDWGDQGGGDWGDQGGGDWGGGGGGDGGF